MGKLIAYCREECHYSNNTKNIINKLTTLLHTNTNTKSLNIEFITNIIQNNDVEKNNIRQSLKHIIGDHATFPIIIYETSRGEQYFIGGDSELKNIILLVDKFTVTNSNNFLSDITLYFEKLSNYNNGKQRLIYYLLLLNNKINLQ